MKFYTSILAILIWFTACSQSDKVTKLSAVDFENGIKDTTVQLLDVRTEEEFEDGFIKNATNINWNGKNFKDAIAKLDKNKPTYVYCLSGGRSKQASNFLAEQGFTKIYDLGGGILEWKYQAKPVVYNQPTKVLGMTMEEYNKAVNKDKPVLVEFYATWCGPCKTLKPTVEAIGAEYADKLEVLFIDVDKNNLVADSLNIRSIPLLLYYKNGKKQLSLTGTQSKRDLIKKLKL
jgi:thioredoxin 1